MKEYYDTLLCHLEKSVTNGGTQMKLKPCMRIHAGKR